MELEALTGHLYIINGEIQSGGQPPGLLAQPAPAGADRSRQRDHLFVHLTLTGPPEETESLLQDLSDAISSTFFQSTGSVTAALRQAMLKANRLLFDFNMSSGTSAREGALTCAARRGQDLFMVQAGEALAMIGRAFGVERLPTQLPDRITPLGRTAGIDMRFFHNVLEPGDLLLLSDPRLGHLSAQAMEPALVDSEVERGLDQLVRIIGPGTARVLLVEFTDDPLDDIPESGAAATLSLPRIERPPLRAPGVSVERTARRSAAQTARGLSRATDGLADVMSEIRPPRDRDAEEPAGGWLMPLALAILIPVVIGAIVAGVYLQRDIVRQTAEVELGMSEALSAGEIAEREERLDDARLNYVEVLRLADDAESSLGAINDFMGGMRREAQLALDRLDNISRLATQPLYTFDDETVRLSRLTLRDELGEGDFYVLDQANNRVWQFLADESLRSLESDEPRRLFGGGDAIGGHIVGSMADLIWRPAGRTFAEPQLGILDISGAVLTWEPNEGSGGHVPVDLASEWAQPVAFTTYNERLYVLDRGNAVLWRYFPDNNRYVLQEGSRVLTFRDDAALAEAVDFDINNEDAKVVIVYADGDIRYYDSNSGLLLWSSDDLANQGLTTPLVAPVSVKIVGRGVSSSIFVADAGTGRVIQLSQNGEVLAQYKATDESGGELFNTVGDFAVKLNPLRILLPIGNVIYLATQ